MEGSYTDGWTQRIAASTFSTPTSKITSNSASFQTSTNYSSAQETSTSAQPSVNNAPKTGDLTSRFDAQMRDLYTNAVEFLSGPRQYGGTILSDANAIG